MTVAHGGGRATTRADRVSSRTAARNDLLVAPLLFALPIAGLVTATQAIGWSWLPLTAFAVGVLVMLGTVVRLIGSDTLRTRALAWWVQAGSLAGILVVREAAVSDWEAALSLESVWGLLQSLGLSIGQGVSNMAWYSAIPFPESTSTATVIMLAAGVITLLNDLVLRVVRVPAVAMAWVFLPALIPMIIQLPMHPLLLAPAAVLFVVALLTCGSGGPSGRTRRAGMVALAGTAAIVIALPLMLPNPHGTQWRFPDLFTRSGWFAPVSPELSEDIDLASHLARPNPVEIMRYTTSDGGSTYLRLTALDDTSQGGFTETPLEERSLRPTAQRPILGPLHSDTFEFDIESVGFGTRYLPLPTDYFSFYSGSIPISGVEPITGAVHLGGEQTELENGATWRGTGQRAVQDLSMFRPMSQAPFSWTAEGMLPEELEELRPLAQEIVGDARSEVEMMERLVEWFSTEDWQYSEEIPFAGFGSETGGQWRALLSFIEERVGYCVHYASALTALALALGIEARVAIGFLPGERQDDGSFSVTTNDMHAWTEVHLRGIGWVSFDVTPPILAGEDSASDPGGNPYGPNGTAPTPRPTDTESPGPSDDPSPSPSESDDPSPSDSDDAPTPTDELSPSDDPGPTGDGDTDAQADDEPGPDLGWVILLLGVVFVLALPALIRGARRTLRRRAGVVGAWHEIVDTAIDTGAPLPEGLTGAQTVLILRERLPESLGAALASIRLDAEAASFGRPGSNVKPYDAAQVRAISRALWRHASPFGSALRHWFPPSLLPRRLRSMQN